MGPDGRCVATVVMDLRPDAPPHRHVREPSQHRKAHVLLVGFRAAGGHAHDDGSPDRHESHGAAGRIRDGAALVVIASNFGRTRSPGWYHNLRSDPRASVTVHGTTWHVVAPEIDGAEREWFFQQGVHMHPGWAHYRRRAAGRRIPVIRLEPTSGPIPSG